MNKNTSAKYFFMVLIMSAVSEGLTLVMLLPSGQAPICHGEQLQLTCNTTEMGLKWSYSLYNEQGLLMNYTRKISSLDMSQQHSQIIVNSTLFEFARISDQSLPLISTLTINSVVNGLNGVDIGCTGLTQDFETAVATTTLSVINESYYNFGDPEPRVNSKVQFGMENVTVTLEWAKEAGVSYNVSIIPQVNVEYLNSTLIQVVAAYNIMYNISIVSTLCGQHTAIKFKKLCYAKCEYPSLVDNSVKIADNHSPALEGDTLTFSCPPGKILIGSNMTTCMENGEWDPNMGEVKCAANCGLPSFPINSYGQVYLDNTTMEGTRVLFLCSNDIQHSIEEAHVAVCNPDGNWQPNPASICLESDISAHDHSRITTALVSSATVFIITSIVVMFFGFLCGRFMKCQSSPSLSPSECKCDSSISSQLSHSCPVYETITAVNYQQQNVNLMENVAYDSVQLN